MRKTEEQIWEQMVLPQVSMLLDPMSVRGTSRYGMKALSAALLTVVAPAYSSACPDNATHPENQIVLMQCLAKSMTDEIIKRELRNSVFTLFLFKSLSF